jgi:F-type H+-transporting ATPase subunit gamma
MRRTRERRCVGLVGWCVQLASVLYVGLLENQASELGSRMSAMDSSTKNANEMLNKLTLTYNRSRQAAITTELIEIISGAAALEG